ncbi:MAG: PH domain-containing protein [Oscillospiraceae bacterium]|nr:PH domain-containing protein [Oscillospiraceae bacterium]
MTFLLITAMSVWFLYLWIVSGSVFLLIMAIIFIPLTAFFIMPIWVFNYYLFDGDNLVIKIGLSKKVIIPFDDIISAVSTRNPISSAALSMDRIELKYRFKANKFADTMLISPVNRLEFLEELKSRNENIEIVATPQPMDKSMKIFLTVILGFTSIVLAGSAIMMVVGEFDPIVSVSGDGVSISGMYGITIRSDEITDIILIEDSMRGIFADVGAMRTNGFDGFGQAQKGYFSSLEYGSHIRFVQTRSSPTILIERRAYNVFISFRDGEKTRELYNELVRLINNDN